MNLDLRRRALRAPLAAAGVIVALGAAGCSPLIESQSGEQHDVIGDVSITTNQCVPLVAPHGYDGFLVGLGRGKGEEELCDGPIPLRHAEKMSEMKRSVASRGGPPSYPAQLLLAYEIPNGAIAPESFAFNEIVEEPGQEPSIESRGAREPQSGEYRASSSYAAELEELRPSGDDTKWAAYASTPVRAYWFERPRWTSAARFEIEGVDETQPFRGPFGYGTVVGSRRLASEEQADTPIDCDEIDGNCVDDSEGIEEEERTRSTARKLAADAPKIATRDLAVAARGDQVNITAGQSGDIPFELRYAGKPIVGAFDLSGTTTIPGATVTAVPATFSPLEDQTGTANVRVTVPAGTPAGTYGADLVASLSNGQKRSAAATFTVAADTPAQIIAASARTCISRRSFTIRLRQTKRDPLVSAVVTVNGVKVKTVKKGRITAPVQLAGLPKGRFTVKITAKTRSGKTRTGTRKYLTCTPKRKGGTPKL